MEEFKSNSHKSKQEQFEELPEKRVETVVVHPTSIKKKGEIRKFAEVFLPDDVSNVKSFVLADLLFPALKRMLHDFGSSMLDSFLGGYSRDYKRSATTRYAYEKDYRREDDRRRSHSAMTKSGRDYDGIVFYTRGDADAVLDRMYEIIHRYEFVRVTDLYDLAGRTPDNYAIGNYGWTDLRGSKPIQVKEGWILKLPRAMPIDD